MVTLDDKLLGIAGKLVEQGVPIRIDDEDIKEPGVLIKGPAPEEIWQKHPEDFSEILYAIFCGLDLRQVEAPCVYVRADALPKPVICYFDKPRKTNCPIAPLCRVYKNF
ncbi:MAG: hypothetical protein NTY99_02995 [DPANN group archaeon]|nr:hypothetical protein [DPANN group archaeon]